MKSDTFLFVKDLKKKLFRWRLVAFIAFFAIIVSSTKDVVLNSEKKSYFIARVNINTPINNGYFSKEYLDYLNNESIKGIILNIDSNGGDVVESEKLYSFFRKLADKKPIVSMINGIGTSGAYMVAMASDYIVAYNTSTVGSIGVILQTYEVTDLAKKVGISLTNYKSSPLKASPNPMERATRDVDSVVSQQINDVYNYFLNIFVQRRKIKIAEAQEIANGQVYTGRQALEYGLIDKIGSDNEILEYFKSKNLDIDKLKIIDYNIYVKNSRINFINNLIDSSTFNKVKAIYSNL